MHYVYLYFLYFGKKRVLYNIIHKKNWRLTDIGHGCLLTTLRDNK